MTPETTPTSQNLNEGFPNADARINAARAAKYAKVNEPGYDSHKALLERTFTPEGEKQLSHLDAAQEQAMQDSTIDQLARVATVSSNLALEEQAAQQGWDQDRLDRAKAARAVQSK